VDWGYEFHEFPGSKGEPREVIESAVRELPISERIMKVSHGMTNSSGVPGFPALAIPVEKKNQFACPPEHLKALADVIPQVTKIITIGWRAMEEHFLAMLKNRLTGLKGDVDLMVASGNLKGATETNANLGLVNPGSGHKYQIVETGFSGLISGIGLLEQFLQ
jgi:hypothetical protein